MTGRRRDKVQQEVVVELERQVFHTPLPHHRLGSTGGGAVGELCARWPRAWHGRVRAAWLQVREREGCLDAAWSRSRVREGSLHDERRAGSRSRRSAEIPRAWALGLGDFGGLLGRALLVGAVLAPRADAAVRVPPATALARAHRGLAKQTHAHAAVRREPALQAAAAGFGDDILVGQAVRAHAYLRGLGSPEAGRLRASVVADARGGGGLRHVCDGGGGGRGGLLRAPTRARAINTQKASKKTQKLAKLLMCV